MKKLITIISLAVIAITASFAESDLQVQAGFQFTNISTAIPIDLYFSTYNIDFNAGRMAGQLNITNYNLFNLGSHFQLGFMESIGGYYGMTTNPEVSNSDLNICYQFPSGAAALGATALIGPAVGIKINNALKIQGSFGFACDFNSEIYGSNTYDSGSGEASIDETGLAFGYGADVEIKFLPNCIVSPIIGFRYSNTKSNPIFNYSINEGIIDISSSSETTEVDYESFLGTIGLSINF